MGFFCTNAQEEALKEIAWQMKITNKFEMIRELHEQGAVSDTEYIKSIQEILKIA